MGSMGSMQMGNMGNMGNMPMGNMGMGGGCLPGNMPGGNMGGMGMGMGMPGNMGGNMAGGNMAGGSMAGNMAGGNMAGGSMAGGNMAGGNMAGGNMAGGNMAGGMGGVQGNNMGGSMGNGNMMGGMNPMMAMMGMMMGMQAAMQTGSEAAADATPTIKSEDKHVDPRVKAICNDFGISGDTVMRLNDAMREREDYDEDLQALHKLMERATKDGKKPLEVMLAQIRAIRANRFPGKELLDPDIWEFIVKYNLDDRVMNRLIETLNKRRGKSKETLEALNDRLGNAQQPTGLGLLVRLLEGLDETGRLPSPPRRLGGSGTFRPTGTFLHPAASSREAREAREREQERSRGRQSERRSRSRGREARRSRSRRR
ncbi:Uncharacterized protein SCF082_LOCUS12655 [Durusdinium trenchii]